MSYSVCRFWAYDEAKKFLNAGPQSPAWKLALAGSMGKASQTYSRFVLIQHTAGGIAGVIGNPGGMYLIYRSRIHILISVACRDRHGAFSTSEYVVP